MTVCAPTFAASARACLRDARRIARDDLGDSETGVVQRHGQKSCQAPGSDDGNGGLSRHYYCYCPFASRFSAQRRSIPYIVVMAKLAGTKLAGTKAAQARVLSSRISYQGPVFSVTTDEVEEPGGVRARRDVIRHSGSIVVLAVDDLAKAGRKGGTTHPARTPVSPCRAVDDVGVARRTHRRWRNGAHRRQARVT